MTVIDLSNARAVREWRKMAYGNYDFSFPEKDVTRYVTDGELRPTDPITLVPATRDKLLDLFTQFGLPHIPQTYGELARNLSYCKMLMTSLLGYPGVPLDVGIQVAESWNPNWGPRVKALAEGNLALLTQLHDDADVFRRNGLRDDDKRSTSV